MATAIYPSFKLGDGAIRSGISTIVDVPSHNLLAVASRNGIIRIIRNSPKGSKQLRMFDKHEGEVMLGQGLVHLMDDILCSMDASGNIYTWSAAWGYVIHSIKLQTFFNFSYNGDSEYSGRCIAQRTFGSSGQTRERSSMELLHEDAHS